MKPKASLSGIIMDRQIPIRYGAGPYTDLNTRIFNLCSQWNIREFPKISHLFGRLILYDYQILLPKTLYPN